MKKHWFYRLLLSYLPIFFFVVLVLIMIFYWTVYTYASRQISKTNELFAEQMVLAVDSALKTTEQIVTREVGYNENLIRFFMEKKPLSPYELFLISQEINKLYSSIPSIHSIYIYNPYTGQLLTQTNLKTLDGFMDKAFIEDRLRDQSVPRWTDPRAYSEFVGDEQPAEVVSLARKAPFNSVEQGLIVVNLQASAIQSMITNNARSSLNFVALLDKQGVDFKRNPFLKETNRMQDPNSKVLAQVRSSYTGWTVQTGLYNGNFSFFSAVSFVWVVLGGVVVLAGLVLLTYITHRHYKPIEAIIRRMQPYSVKLRNEFDPQQRKEDEFAIIHSVFDELEKKSNSLELLHREDLKFRSKHFFLELLQGNRPVELEEWRQELERIGLPADFDQLCAVVVEIDQYNRFGSQYSPRDQALLKYVIASVLRDLATQHRTTVWSEWVEPHQLGVICLLKNGMDLHHVYDWCKKAQVWVNEHLSFTITVGIGTRISEVDEIVDSYEEAKETIEYKTVLGNNRVIAQWEVLIGHNSFVFGYLNIIHSFAHSFRLGNEEWRTHIAHLFEELRKGLFLRRDIGNLMHYILYYLEKEMTELSYEFSHVFLQSTLPQLRRMIAEVETIDEIQEQATSLLAHFYAQFQEMKEKRSNHHLLSEVKAYIETNYGNPDLSLNHLSDAFGLSPRYLSKLFKEHFGGKFVDYMVAVRIDHARNLLEKTNKSVYEIGEKVGYVHVLSFIRAFKKVVGLTPGDYRRKRNDAG